MVVYPLDPAHPGRIPVGSCPPPEEYRYRAEVRESRRLAKLEFDAQLRIEYSEWSSDQGNCLTLAAPLAVSLLH
jgi:hypothetical protein